MYGEMRSCVIPTVAGCGWRWPLCASAEVSSSSERWRQCEQGVAAAKRGSGCADKQGGGGAGGSGVDREIGGEDN